jgi:hypothetical protein
MLVEVGRMAYYPDFHDEEEEQIGLVRLSRVTYQLADGQPDAMGWQVADVEGVIFGTVADMLADAGTGQIVFVAVKTEESGKIALVPVEGMAHDLLIVPARETDVINSPEFTDEVVDVMPFVDYWVSLARV